MPVRWLLAILGTAFTAAFLPLYGILDQAGSTSPAHVLIIVLGGLFMSARWTLGLWGQQRYERLLADEHSNG